MTTDFIDGKTSIIIIIIIMFDISIFCGHNIFHFRRLGVKSGGASVYHKTNRETMVEIGDSIRGKDIYIIQTGTK